MRIYANMAQLARHAAHAMPDFSIQHDAAAHAGTQGQHADAVVVARRSLPLFAQRGGVGVILQDDRRTQPALDFRAHRAISPVRQIG